MTTTTMEFKAEMKQLMDIIVHSLYSDKEIFLRELISNACDAIDKVRFESITSQELLENNADWKIKIIADKQNMTLSISDNGLGMSRETIIEDLGTIAKSSTSEFIEQLKNADSKERPELIGKFGVGFYSSFMVADKVTVISRIAGNSADGVKWESDGLGKFTVENVEKESRGTDIILHLRQEGKEFLEEWRIKSIVKKFSDFVEHPIVMDVEKEDENKKKTIQQETLNSQKAIWLKPKSEISQDDYHEFYKHITHDFQDPAKVMHYNAEGIMEFRALLYLPKKKPFSLMDDPDKYGPHLYIKRVFISDNCRELLPPYLRFVKGVVDSSDLPLNVSREMLQNNPMLPKIQKNLVNYTLKTLEVMLAEEKDEYINFYMEFGSILKMGVYGDFENKDRLAELLLFESTQTEPGKFVSLGEYVEKMPSDQKEIYYLTGESRKALERSPYLELFTARNHEVLLMTDPVDEWVVQGIPEYKDKKLKAVNKGEIEEDKTDEKAKKTEEFKSLLEFMKSKIEEVKEIRISTRLKESASCLVVDEHEMGAHMEKLMKQFGQDSAREAKRILELNATHPAVEAVQKLFEKNPSDPRLTDYASLFYDQAVLAEGSNVKDPVAFAKRINTLLTKDASSNDMT